MNPMCRRLLLPGLLLSAACATPPLMVDGRSGSPVEVAEVAEACANEDVVFFGEVHTSPECHERQRQLLIRLHRHRPDLVVSMEVFERDVQEHLDAYLAGKLPEAEFRKKARVGKSWELNRPVVQFAAMHALPVIAANAPKEVVRKVSSGGGLAAIEGREHVAQEVKAPRDAYFEAFVKVMTDGKTTAAEVDANHRLMRYYEAQCVWDETMAQSIADYLDAAHKAGRRPLVVHLCGNFHAAQRRGTVARLVRRMPKLAVKVIATTAEERVEVSRFQAKLGDYHLLVPKVASTGANDGKGHAKLHEPHAKKDPAEKDPAKTEHDPDARPGLGFMPAYEEGDIPGAGVDRVSAGGAAEKAGIKDGDLIVKLAGEEIDDLGGYMQVLGSLRIGQKVKVVVLRGEKEIELDVTVGRSNR